MAWELFCPPNLRHGNTPVPEVRVVKFYRPHHKLLDITSSETYFSQGLLFKGGFPLVDESTELNISFMSHS